MKRGKQDNKVLFIDATNECIKITNNNKLTEKNIDSIVNAFSARKDQEYFCRLVPYDEIKDNNYTLSVSSYVAQQDTREAIDIDALNEEIKAIVSREMILREEFERIIFELNH